MWLLLSSLLSLLFWLSLIFSFPVEKSIFLLFFSSFGEIIPKKVFPSLISLKDFSIKPKAFIFIIKPSWKYRLSKIFNSNLGAIFTISFSLFIISSDTSSFILFSLSKFISSSFNVLWIVWASVFVKFLSVYLSSIFIKGLVIWFLFFSLLSKVLFVKSLLSWEQHY